jgi:hypothetical protein
MPFFVKGVKLAAGNQGPVAGGDRTYKLHSGTTSEYGRYVKSLGEPRDGRVPLGLRLIPGGIDITTREIAEKWGFGLAPVKPHTQKARQKAAKLVLASLLEGEVTSPDLPDAVSEIKGLFNRVHRMDQWDWFTVYLELGGPPVYATKTIGKLLQEYRRCLTGKSDADMDEVKAELMRRRTQLYLREFPRPADESDNWETVYILSTREDKDILKIGFTTRSVLKRVKEINSSTGVLTPFGVRRIWRVEDGAGVEKVIHDAFDDCRIRSDREFFRCDFHSAVQRINGLLKDPVTGLP